MWEPLVALLDRLGEWGKLYDSEELPTVLLTTTKSKELVAVPKTASALSAYATRMEELIVKRYEFDSSNIPLGGKPEYAVSAVDGEVYANLTDTGEVVEIDAKSATFVRRWSTAHCKQPVSMAIDKVHHRLFSGCRSGVMAVSDYQAGKVAATIPIGKGVDGAGYDPASGNAFASNADGSLTVIHQDNADRYHVLESVPDTARLPQHGPRSHKSPGLHGFCGVWARSRRWRTEASATWNIHADDDGTQSVRALTSFLGQHDFLRTESN